MPKYRIKWQKIGDARWLSHLDIARAWQRTFIRAGIRVKYSQGFSPHQKMAFSPALPVGTAGYGEYLDVHLEESRDPLSVPETLNRWSPAGLRAVAGAELAERVPSLGAAISMADYEVRVGSVSADEFGILQSSLSDCLTALIGMAKNVDERTVALSSGKLGMDAEDNRFELRVPIQIRPRTFLEAISDLPGAVVKLRTIDRVGLWVLADGMLVDPLDSGAPEL